MTPEDAEALVSVMQAEWLAGEWLDDNGELTTRGTMYALVLVDFPPEIGAEAIARLRKRIPYRQGPQTADLKNTLAEVAAERTLATPALPSFDGVPVCCRGASGMGHAYREHFDDDMKARVVALLEMPKRPRHDETVMMETFARVVGGLS